jgi:hypothetical protein
MSTRVTAEEYPSQSVGLFGVARRRGLGGRRTEATSALDVVDDDTQRRIGTAQILLRVARRLA